MKSNGIHFMALESANRRLDELRKNYEVANGELQEALKMGDLSECAEYEMSKEAIKKIVAETDKIEPYLTYPVVRCSDSEQAIQEGSVIDLVVYGVSENPVKEGSAEYKELIARPPVLSGRFMFGGNLEIHTLLGDKMLSPTTPIGRYLLWKASGYYSVKTPGGFTNLRATKVPLKDLTTSDLRCDF